MAEISHYLFPMRRSSWASANASKYNKDLEEMIKEATKKFEVPEWKETVEHVNTLAEIKRPGWAQYPKITPTAWKVHLRFEEELDIKVYPALFTYSFPFKDAGTISWYMLNKRQIHCQSNYPLSGFAVKRNKIQVGTEYGAIYVWFDEPEGVSEAKFLAGRR